VDQDMLTFRDVVSGFRKLKIESHFPVVAHGSLSAFGEVRGGVETVLAALLATVDDVMMPAFTYKTMVIPELGPEGNAIAYGSGRDLNRMAEFFTPDMPADPMMGILPEKLRHMPEARRSNHPILSFTGIGVDAALQAQTLSEPLAPIRVLSDAGGWVLLIGVDHTVNTSLHYAEKLAGRRQFTRWALTPSGILECPGFPGCSDGFEKAASLLSDLTRVVQIGEARILALPLSEMLQRIKNWLTENPTAMLCDRVDCERCNEVRRSVENSSSRQKPSSG
jgi:aminoglycoside 3-N-acetyltransferase